MKEEIDNDPVKFAEFATMYSACPSGRSGGNLGEFGPNQMVKECVCLCLCLFLTFHYFIETNDVFVFNFIIDSLLYVSIFVLFIYSIEQIPMM